VLGKICIEIEVVKCIKLKIDTATVILLTLGATDFQGGYFLAGRSTLAALSHSIAIAGTITAALAGRIPS